MNDYSSLAGLFAIFAALGIFVFLIGIIFYILFALGLMTLAKNKNLENPWLAWIPFANLYLLGQLIESLEVFGWKVPNLPLFLALAPVASIVLGGVPLIGQLVALATLILLAFALYKLFNMYRPNSAMLFTILGIILGLAPIFVFIIRNDSPILKVEEVNDNV